MNICHVNNDRVTRGLRRFVCGKEVVWWQIIHRPQGRVNTLGLSIDWKVRIGAAPVQI